MISMTSYHARLGAFILLAASACSGADTPTAKPAAKPAATAKAAPAPAATATRYVQAKGGSLAFAFMQAGAENTGAFRQFATELQYDANRLAASSLKVTVQIASLDTQDKDRDAEILGADLFDAKKYPTAQFVASSFAKGANGGVEAVGKLTLRGVTHDLRLPLSIQSIANGVELSGETTIRRLEYGVGQGDYKSTEWVGDEVKLQYKVPLAKAG
jgi:polyisoprenoid-binding protein YceI